MASIQRRGEGSEVRIDLGARGGDNIRFIVALGGTCKKRRRDDVYNGSAT